MRRCAAIFPLDEPDDIVIMQEMGMRIFGGEDPIGKLAQRNNHRLKVADPVKALRYEQPGQQR